VYNSNIVPHYRNATRFGKKVLSIEMRSAKLEFIEHGRSLRITRGTGITGITGRSRVTSRRWITGICGGVHVHQGELIREKHPRALAGSSRPPSWWYFWSSKAFSFDQSEAQLLIIAKYKLYSQQGTWKIESSAAALVAAAVLRRSAAAVERADS
jgi:hypothetical protein